jgi:hypothetical protein
LIKVLALLPLKCRLNMRKVSRNFKELIDTHKVIIKNTILKLECRECFEFLKNNKYYNTFKVDMRLPITDSILRDLRTFRKDFTLILDNFDYNHIDQLSSLLPFLSGLGLYIDNENDKKLFEFENDIDLTGLKSLAIKYISSKENYNCFNEELSFQETKELNNTRLFQRIKISNKNLKVFELWDYCGDAELIAEFFNGLKLKYLELGIQNTCSFHRIGTKVENVSFSAESLRLFHASLNKGFSLGLLRYLEPTNLKAFSFNNEINKDIASIITSIKELVNRAENLKFLSVVTESATLYDTRLNTNLNFIEFGLMNYRDIETKLSELTRQNYLSINIRSISIILSKYVSEKSRYMVNGRLVKEKFNNFKSYFANALPNFVLKYNNIRFIYIIYSDSTRERSISTSYSLSGFYKEFSKSNEVLSNIELFKNVRVYLLQNYENEYFVKTFLVK